MEGKLRKVMELVGLPWTPDDRPLHTVLELKQLRDLIAHGKAERLQGTVLHGHDEEGAVSTIEDARAGGSEGYTGASAARHRGVSGCHSGACQAATERA